MSAEVLLELETMVQWNPPANGKVKLGRECDDVGGVRGTSYGEVHELIGTSGCSKQPPYWNWSTMGVIEDPIGNRLVVSPGDWILKMGPSVSVMTNESRETFFNSPHLKNLLELNKDWL